FFVSIGLKINFVTNFDLGLTMAVLAISFAGKIIGSGLGAAQGGFNFRESLAVGFGMNARGAMEIILGLIALENGLIDEKLFVALVIMAIVTSMTSGPLMKLCLGTSKTKVADGLGYERSGFSIGKIKVIDFKIVILVFLSIDDHA